MPSDIVGTRIYNQKAGEFEVALGPIFANLVLADEINRAPAKVQSALLEAMAERQVSIGGHTRALPQPFVVLATQNPIESEGVYNLPEAQRDRFLMHVVVPHPTYEEETAIATRMSAAAPRSEQVLTTEQLLELPCDVLVLAAPCLVYPPLVGWSAIRRACCTTYWRAGRAATRPARS